MQSPLLYYEIHGTRGPFLLMVHGLLSSRAQWMPNLEVLQEFCRPVVVELFGHGRSPAPEDPACYAPDSYVREFEAIRREVGPERWFLCGQSLGASLTLRYALHHPERTIAQIFTNSRSALSDTSSPEAMKVLAERLEQEGRKMIDSFPLHPSRSRHMRSDVKEALIEDAKKIDLGGFSKTMLYTAPHVSLRRVIQKNQVPTLLIAGRFDKQFKPLVEFARASIPKIEVIILDGGHAVNIHVSGRFNEAVRNFMARFDGN